MIYEVTATAVVSAVVPAPIGLVNDVRRILAEKFATMFKEWDLLDVLMAGGNLVPKYSSGLLVGKFVVEFRVSRYGNIFINLVYSFIRFFLDFKRK